MLKNNYNRLFIILSIVVVAGLLIVNSGIVLNAAEIPNTPENQEILAAIEKTYEVLAIPPEQLDIHQLSEVLINHPYYYDYVSHDELTTLIEYTKEVQGSKETANFGYLTSMRTKRINQQQGAKLLREARKKAKAENREVSQEELKELTKQNHGLEPYLPPETSQAQPVSKRVLLYDSVKVDGDRALVRYDDGAKNRTALLVNIKGRWYVAGIF